MRCLWYITALFAAALLPAGCLSGSGGVPQSVMEDVNPFGWLREQRLEFHNDDTVSLRDIAILLRCGADADEGELPMEIKFTAPDSSRFVERRTIPLVLRRGPVSTAETVAIPYRRSVRLTQRGVYSVSLKPLASVRGIEAAGITIEKQQ